MSTGRRGNEANGYKSQGTDCHARKRDDPNDTPLSGEIELGDMIGFRQCDLVTKFRVQVEFAAKQEAWSMIHVPMML